MSYENNNFQVPQAGFEAGAPQSVGVRARSDVRAAAGYSPTDRSDNGYYNYWRSLFR